MSKAFTLIEVIIIIAIISLLAIVIFSVINPIEQINKGRDIGLIETSRSIVMANDRYLALNKSALVSGEVQTALLSSNTNMTILDSLVSTGELKNSFLSNQAENLHKIYFTKDETETEFKLCFMPKSKAYQVHQNTVFNQSGNLRAECLQNTEDCYFCFGNFTLSDVIADEGGGGTDPDDDNSDDVCKDIDPEYPDYPWTCNYSTKWSEYSCTNYCTLDIGCDDFCPEGQRHVRKNYHASGSDFVTCFNHNSETKEDYCIADPYARCDIKTWSSNLTDYEWGCTDPRRPTDWIE